MIILKTKIKKENLIDLSKLGEPLAYFDYMVKGVVDIKRGLIAINAELHSDLEELLLEDGSDNRDLYGINITFENFEIEYDSLINPPRNREAGYPRVGRYVADPEVRKKIKEIVEEWIEI